METYQIIIVEIMTIIKAEEDNEHILYAIIQSRYYEWTSTFSYSGVNTVCRTEFYLRKKETK
jgi:hypothetical protein